MSRTILPASEKSLSSSKVRLDTIRNVERLSADQVLRLTKLVERCAASHSVYVGVLKDEREDLSPESFHLATE